MKPAPLNWPPKAINANYWGDPFLLQWTHNARKRIWVKVQTFSCNERSISFLSLLFVSHKMIWWNGICTSLIFEMLPTEFLFVNEFQQIGAGLSKKHNWVPRLSSPFWLKGGGTGMVSWSKAIPLRWDGLHLALARLSNYPCVHTNAHLRATHCKPVYCNWIREFSGYCDLASDTTTEYRHYWHCRYTLLEYYGQCLHY